MVYLLGTRIFFWYLLALKIYVLVWELAVNLLNVVLRALDHSLIARPQAMVDFNHFIWRSAKVLLLAPLAFGTV